MDLLTSGVEILLSLFLLWALRACLTSYPKTTALFFATAAYKTSHFFTSPLTSTSSFLSVTTMKAALFAPGVGEHGIEVKEIPVPHHHKDYELLVKVRAAGLNPSNFKVNPSKIPFYRHTNGGHHAIGYDVEGTILSVGSHADCEIFKPDQHVYGFASSGSIAEYAVVACARAGRSPKSLTPVESGGLPVVALTSLEAWDRTHLKAGDHVLVIGASGGCGTFGVSIAKARHATVTGICSTKNVELVKGLGADVVVDYTQQTQMNALIQGGRQFDIIYDTVSSFAPEDPDYEPTMRPLLKTGGKYVAINGYPLDWTRAIWEKILFNPFFNVSIQRKDYDLFLLTPTSQKLHVLATMIDSGQVAKTVVDTVYPLTEETLNEAFALIKSRRVVGKIIFEFSPPPFK